MDIYDACRNGDIDTLKSIHDNDPQSIHQPNEMGFSPLTLAVYSNQEEVVKFLLSQNVNVDHRDRAGNNAAMGAVFKGYLNQVALLIEAGSDVNHQNNDGATALSYAATFGHTAIADYLLKANADPSLKDNQGNSPLDYAKMRNHDEIVALLSEV